MKISKMVVSILLIIALGISWLSFARGIAEKEEIYRAYRADAEASEEEGLYEQAIENYKKAFSYKRRSDIYKRILGVYEKFYSEEPTAHVRNLYIQDMEEACELFPKETEYWKKQISLYLEMENDRKAYNAAKAAVGKHVNDEEIEKIYKRLLYKVKTNYQLYSDYKTCLNGYISVSDGNQWKVLNEAGAVISENYQFIGLINDDGMGIYVNDIDTRLLDKKEITRARFDIGIDEAGYYSESLGIVPIKVNGVWKYLKSDGEFLDGEYEMAGSFYDKQAAVKKDGVWYLVNEKGEKISEDTYEDIKLDLYGCHRQGDIILAKKNGIYHLYNSKWEQIGDFACDNVDICIDNGLIAFEKNGLWGYVNKKGEVIVKPQYARAKSFSNNMAAVCGQNGKWGFINKDYELVIDCSFLDAGYFTSAETCMVSTQEGGYQILEFVFD